MSEVLDKPELNDKVIQDGRRKCPQNLDFDSDASRA